MNGRSTPHLTPPSTYTYEVLFLWINEDREYIFLIKLILFKERNNVASLPMDIYICAMLCT